MFTTRSLRSLEAQRARRKHAGSKLTWSLKVDNQVNLLFHLLPPCLSCFALKPASQSLLSQSKTPLTYNQRPSRVYFDRINWVFFSTLDTLAHFSGRRA